MHVVLMAQADTVDHAIKSAQSIGHGDAVPLPGLHSLSDNLMAYIDDAWATVETALRGAYRYGQEKAAGAMRAAHVRVQEMMDKAGSQAEKFRKVMLERLRRFLSDLVNQSIGLLPERYVIGGNEFEIEGIGCTQSISLSGSLEFSLDRVFAITSEGQFEIEVSYAKKRSQNLSGNRGLLKPR